MKNYKTYLLALLILVLAPWPAMSQTPTTHTEADNLLSIAEDLSQIGQAKELTRYAPHENTPQARRDSLAATLTPAMADSLQSTLTDTLQPATAKRPGLIRRIINYYSRSNVDRTFEKKIDWSIAPGPNYSSDVGFGLGFLLAGLYRIDRTDSITAPSNVSVYGNFTTKKFVLLRCSGENNYNLNRQRFNYSGAFVYFPGAFYGVGYNDGAAGYAQSLTTTNAIVRLSYCTAIAPNAYIGVSGGIDYSGAKYARSGIGDELEAIHRGEMENPGGELSELYDLWLDGRYDPAKQDPFSNYIDATGDKPNAFNTHIGLFFQYDTRDITFNASRGLFLKAEAKWYPRYLGNTGRDFGRFGLTFDWYRRLWKGAVLAYDLYADAIVGTPSWHMYAKLGGVDRMRGYYEGRYRDKRMVETQLELRQKIYRRHGIVGWFGVGNIWGQQDFRWDRTLYSFGVGYRFEFKSHMNIRLDYGWGVYGNSNLPWDRKRSSAFMFTASEAF